MLLAWYHHTDVFVALAPGHDVHHRFGLVATQGHRLVQAAEEFLVPLLSLGDNDKGRHNKVVDYANPLLGIEGHYLRQVAAEPLPVGLQGQHTTGACLEVHVVGGRRSTLGTVVEYHHLAMLRQEPVHLAIVLVYGLRGVLAAGYGKVYGQYGEGVDQQQEAVVHRFGHLLLGTVLVTKEARAFSQRLAVYLRPRAYDTGGIEL